MTSIDKFIDKNTIKNIDNNNSGAICEAIRQFLIERVTHNGGHLASNLGVVELTLAMHKVFDFPRDKVVFDVGHQSYVHKILSGRSDKFGSLRKLDGLSGFPKTSESEYDCFNTGHSSTSISAAVGIARARDLIGDDYNVIAFIGDGALGGGMAFEALNDVGATKTKLIIILNDNEMSINHNVGGLSAHLSMLRTNKNYLTAKTKMRSFLNKAGIIGKVLTKIMKTAKKAITFATIAAPMFEELGIKYIGIIDGHNIDDLASAFQKAKNVDGPVIIHALTKKGKGYKPAEDNPDLYHGVSPQKTMTNSEGRTYTRIFGDFLLKKGKENRRIVAITAAMSSGCGLGRFSSEFPQRFFDVGIAEQHAVTLAGGFASRGIIPVFAVYSTFLQRGYDQILHDICMQKLHVIFAIDRAGVVGEDGETHQGIFDFSYLLHLPEMTVLAPSCVSEFEQMLEFAVENCNCPVSIRYPKAIASNRRCKEFVFGKYEVVEDNGDDVVLISIGRMLECCLEVSRALKTCGISHKVINLRTVKPFDVSFLEKLLQSTRLAVTVEDNVIHGGAGQYIYSCVSCDIRSKFLHIGFDDCYVCQGSQDELFVKYGLDPRSITDKIKKELKINE